MTNILVDAHIFDDKFQGTRTYLHGLYQELIKIAPEIDFYFAARNIEHLQENFGVGSNVHYIRLKSQNKFLRLSVEFPYIIKKYKINYAHFQYISPLFKTCKEIVTIHDLLFLDYPEYFPKSYQIKNKLFFKASAKRADLLLTVSEYSKKVISKHFRINPSQIHITPNAISNIFFNKPQTKGAESIRQKYNIEKYILYVGRIEPRKNHILLTQAIYELGLLEKGYKLVFIGKRDLPYHKFDNYISSIPLEENRNILFLDEIENNELVEFYNNCNLFVFPSLAEGFGIPPLEAVATGCECLCSKQTAMQDFDFFGDRLFNPLDIEELKRKITASLNKQIQPLTLQQIEEMKNRYNWRKIAKIYQDILYTVIK